MEDNPIRKARKAKGLTLREVAQALQIKSMSHISNWERGWPIPTEDNYRRLAKVLCVSVRTLKGE